MSVSYVIHKSEVQYLYNCTSLATKTIDQTDPSVFVGPVLGSVWFC